ncbi:MAG: hypothetical protein JO076_02855 [Verrucomicrobia bacterium]|nr:hypothetical protein [Verrucomicrobiota bacterium]
MAIQLNIDGSKDGLPAAVSGSSCIGVQDWAIVRKLWPVGLCQGPLTQAVRFRLQALDTGHRRSTLHFSERNLLHKAYRANALKVRAEDHQSHHQADLRFKSSPILLLFWLVCLSLGGNFYKYC